MTVHKNDWGSLTWNTQVMEVLRETLQSSGDLTIECNSNQYQGRLLSFDNGLVALYTGEVVVTVDMDSVPYWECFPHMLVPRFNSPAKCNVIIDTNPVLSDYGDPNDLL
jgi:hypothetical protein